MLAHYPQMPPLPAHAAWFPTASQAYGEATFICPQHNVLTSLSQHPNSHSRSPRNSTTTPPPPPTPKLYAYRYNVHDAENLVQGFGVPHLFDLAAIFGPDSLPDASLSYKTYNAGVVPLMMGYWLSFVRALDPNRFRMEGAPVWEGWNRETGGRMLIETEGARMEATDGGERGRCEAWGVLGGGRMRQR
jgi:hypothetical protein